AQLAQQHGLAGLEFLSGIPGTVGGALRMNAGAYGREMVDVLVEARAIDPQGRLHVFSPAQMDFSSRRCNGVPEGWIFTGCTLRAQAGDPAAIAAEMARIAEARGSTQPVKS